MVTGRRLFPNAPRLRAGLDELLELGFSFPNAMGFVPVELGINHCSVTQTNFGDAFHLTPRGPTVLPNEPPTISNATPRRDALDQSYRADDLEYHPR
jgi:hypothetical protein